MECPPPFDRREYGCWMCGYRFQGLPGEHIFTCPRCEDVNPGWRGFPELFEKVDDGDVYYRMFQPDALRPGMETCLNLDPDTLDEANPSDLESPTPEPADSSDPSAERGEPVA